MNYHRLGWLAAFATAVCFAGEVVTAEAGHGHEPHHGGHEEHGHREHGSHEEHGHREHGSHEEHGHREHGSSSHHGHSKGTHGAGKEGKILSWIPGWSWDQPWWHHAYASAFFMSLISFAGVGLLVFLKIPTFGAVVEYCCLAFAATVLVADALIHLLPHALEGADHATMSAVGVSATVGCLAILVVPEVCEWHQHHHSNGGADCQKQTSQVHAYGWANLVTEMLHNFVDGISLGLSWMAGTPAGLSTAIAVAVHELPQEIGDFMVLRAAGFPTGQLLLWNFLASLTCAGGVGLVHLLGETDLAASVQRYMTAFTAGTFLSLSLNMIFPQVSESINKNHRGRAASMAKALCCLLAAAAVYALLRIGELEDHGHGHAGHGHGGHGHGGHAEL